MSKFIGVIMMMAALLSISCDTWARDLSGSEKDTVKAAVKQQLERPDTAAFKWVKIADKYTADYANYCVLVNAQTVGGKMSGWRPFGLFLLWEKSGKFTASVTDTPLPGSPSFTHKVCSEHGYTDFSSAR